MIETTMIKFSHIEKMIIKKLKALLFLSPPWGVWGAVLLLASCSGTRHLPDGEKLYTGAEIELESAEHLNKKLIKAAAGSAVRPSPNKVFFGIRPKLWLNNLAGPEPKTKLEKWLKKTGEPPVLMSSVKPSVTAEI
ncbi:MAG: hypothetical protein Q8K69_10920, partial [Bacteroidota bacterium]|nr:hypothetical protein [Bacteroidota bacterium]